MADIEIERRHDLSVEEARRAVEQVAEGLKQKVGGEYYWEDDSLMFSRKGTSGAIVVTAEAVFIAINTGPMMNPFRRQMTTAIEQYLDQYVGVA
jgi:putative polyhydroxyalkanoate system protein